jgi:hypothetical protein
MHALTQATPACALLDVDLTDGQAYAIAWALGERGVPYAFLSASTPEVIPRRLKPFAFLQKPASRHDLLALARSMAAAR